MRILYLVHNGFIITLCNIELFCMIARKINAFDDLEITCILYQIYNLVIYIIRATFNSTVFFENILRISRTIISFNRYEMKSNRAF